jgi:hypothetical protein
MSQLFIKFMFGYLKHMNLTNLPDSRHLNLAVSPSKEHGYDTHVRSNVLGVGSQLSLR